MGREVVLNFDDGASTYLSCRDIPRSSLHPWEQVQSPTKSHRPHRAHKIKRCSLLPIKPHTEDNNSAWHNLLRTRDSTIPQLCGARDKMMSPTSYAEPRLRSAPHANLVDDLTQTSGLVLVYGLIAFIPNIAALAGASDVDVDWDGADEVFPPILNLLGSLTVSLFGLSSIFIGYQYLGFKWGTTTLSLFGLAITLAAWFPFLVTVSHIAFQADHRIVSSPPLLILYPEPTTRQVRDGTSRKLIILFVPYIESLHV